MRWIKALVGRVLIFLLSKYRITIIHNCFSFEFKKIKENDKKIKGKLSRPFLRAPQPEFQFRLIVERNFEIRQFVDFKTLAF